MSRVGKSIIKLPANVQVSIDAANVVTVKGPLGELKQEMKEGFGYSLENGELTVNRPSDGKQDRALHGLYRSLINNMVIGVSEGYKKDLELVGVGYKASNQGQIPQIWLHYSMMIEILIHQTTSNKIC